MWQRERPAWWFDEERDLGFSTMEEIAAYERRSGVDPAREGQRLDDLGAGPGDVLVDLGCGTGTLAVEAAKRCRRVVAVDVSEAMLAYARAKAEAAGVDGIRYVRAGFLTFEPEPQSVDVVVTQRALHHLPDFWKLQALLRVHAMLRVGGVFLLQDLVYSFEPQDAEAAIEAWIEATVGRDGAGFDRAFFETHVREEHSTHSWVLEAMLERTGFEIRDAAFDLRQTYATYTCVKR